MIGHKKCKNCLGDEGRFGGYEGLRGTCKGRIKRMSSAYVTDNDGQLTDF